MVDTEIATLEDNLRNGLEFVLIMGIHRGMWHELDELSVNDRREIEQFVNMAFRDIIHKYELFPAVRNSLEHARILFQTTVWAAMNVPYPRNVNDHVYRVIENAFDAYNNVVYAHMRTEMVMANHAVHVLQRKWRKCYYEPDQPICRRRLMREFTELAA